MSKVLHGLVEVAAAARPGSSAVVDGDRHASYADLDSASNQVAAALTESGLGRGNRIALYMDKSPEAVAAIYGILKTGAAYVPLDPQTPPARLGYVVRDCGVRGILYGRETADRLPHVLQGAQTVEVAAVMNGNEPVHIDGVRALTQADVDAISPSRAATDVNEDDLAYILYTSGSTGDPKGVMLTHRNALAFVLWAADRFAIEGQDRLSSHAPFHFDLSVFDLFAAAAAGAAVVLVPPEASIFPRKLARFIEDEEISIWYSVPAILSRLATRAALKAGDLSSLRTVLFAGEVFPTKYLRALMRLLPHARFFNLYGPTETNVCTYYEVPELPDDMTDPIPIGRPIAGVETIVVTDEGTEAAPGDTGELYVRGATVMQGYWGDAARTDQALVRAPLGADPARPLYRTGDLVCEDTEGNYRFLGRRDAQIKSRGYRIELGDIETALYAHPSVVQCAAVPVPDELVTNRIKAYVATRDPITPIDLARFCEARLPPYMVPDAFEFVSELPKTSTGKIDRAALR
ncbi:MAG: amino acid adenylation domain-containing protein [Actinomycetota bacterium]